MLDTVKLYISDFEVAADAELTVQPAPYVVGSGATVSEYPLWRSGGRTVVGAKAYYNCPLFNLTIRPLAGAARCFVQFSVPKAHNGSNYYGVGQEGAGAVLRLLEKRLHEVGVRTDLAAAKLSRVDLFRNVVADEPFAVYAPLFGLLRAARQSRRDYGTTYLWHNSQHELAVYDKLHEMQCKGMATGGYPANTIRFEVRLLNTKKVAQALGVTTYPALLDNYEGVRTTYRRALEKGVFSLEVDEVEVLTVAGLEAEMAHYMARYGRNWLSRYLQAVGARTIAARAGLEAAKQAVLRLSGADRNKAWRLTKRLEQAMQEAAMFETAPGSRKTYRALYCELREKALAAAEKLHTTTHIKRGAGGTVRRLSGCNGGVGAMQEGKFRLLQNKIFAEGEVYLIRKRKTDLERKTELFLVRIAPQFCYISNLYPAGVDGDWKLYRFDYQGGLYLMRLGQAEVEILQDCLEAA